MPCQRESVPSPPKKCNRFFFLFSVYKHEYIWCYCYDGLSRTVSHRRGFMWTCRGLASFLHSSALHSLTQALFSAYQAFSRLRKDISLKSSLSFPLSFLFSLGVLFFFLFMLHFESWLYQPLGRAQSVAKLWGHWGYRKRGRWRVAQAHPVIFPALGD